MRRVIELASEKGASTWLTSIPLKAYGFRLNKQQFHDALCMRYDLLMFQELVHAAMIIPSIIASLVTAVAMY